MVKNEAVFCSPLNAGSEGARMSAKRRSSPAGNRRPVTPDAVEEEYRREEDRFRWLDRRLTQVQIGVWILAAVFVIPAVVMGFVVFSEMVVSQRSPSGSTANVEGTESSSRAVQGTIGMFLSFGAFLMVVANNVATQRQLLRSNVQQKRQGLEFTHRLADLQREQNKAKLDGLLDSRAQLLEAVWRSFPSARAQGQFSVGSVPEWLLDQISPYLKNAESMEQMRVLAAGRLGLVEDSLIREYINHLKMIFNNADAMDLDENDGFTEHVWLRITREEQVIACLTCSLTDKTCLHSPAFAALLYQIAPGIRIRD